MKPRLEPNPVVFPLLRDLVRCYQAFERQASHHIRGLGLTRPQFDIIATLGNQPGMTFRDLGEKTLITKGTLTGIVDRLERRGLVERIAHAADGRCTLVRITQGGQQLFERIFTPHIAFLERAFRVLDAGERKALSAQLNRLHDALEQLEGAT
jgi:DNA-binding MarR family transcriptional regulator